jgi:hypothetical protein
VAKDWAAALERATNGVAAMRESRLNRPDSLEPGAARERAEATQPRHQRSGFARKSAAFSSAPPSWNSVASSSERPIN